MVADVIAKFGRIDVLVNNAGYNSLHRRILNTTPKEMRSVIDSNLIGTFLYAGSRVRNVESESGNDYQYLLTRSVYPRPLQRFSFPQLERR